MARFSVYCPKCADRIPRDPLGVGFDETVACPSCGTSTKGSGLLTDHGKTLLDHFLSLPDKAQP